MNDARHRYRLEAAIQAQKIVEAACIPAREFFRGEVGVEFKADQSPVTHADKTVETQIRDALQQAFPDDGIFGEEQGATAIDRETVWIVDPIDGTRSFISGLPLFGMLLGRLTEGEVDIGLVAMPALNEIYLGVKGEGASLNGKQISVSQASDLAKATLFINEGDKLVTEQEALFKKLCVSGQTRRLAADCYPHALLAAGHVDVVVDYDLKPYDYLPVAGLVQAAGGIITDWNGDKLTMDSDGRVVSCATKALHEQMLDLFSRVVI